LSIALSSSLIMYFKLWHSSWTSSSRERHFELLAGAARSFSYCPSNVVSCDRRGVKVRSVFSTGAV
jgi:hypothetical protein